MSKFNKKPLRITVHKKVIAFSENGKQEYIPGIDFEALVARKAAIMQSLAERKSASEATWVKPSLPVSVSLSSLSLSTRVALAKKVGSKVNTENKKEKTRVALAQNSKLEVNTENKTEQSEIIKEAAPNNLKHKHQSDDETVEENKMKKIDYVTYHKGHGAQGVPKLVIRSPNILKRKRQSADETVEENKMHKIEYVTYHNGRGAQGVPKLVIRRIKKSHGQRAKVNVRA